MAIFEDASDRDIVPLTVPPTRLRRTARAAAEFLLGLVLAALLYGLWV